MKQFQISIGSFRQVQDFVALAVKQPFEVLVGNDRQKINGKDLMGMFSLDFTRPVQVSVSCSEEEFLRFQQSASAL